MNYLKRHLLCVLVLNKMIELKVRLNKWAFKKEVKIVEWFKVVI